MAALEIAKTVVRGMSETVLYLHTDGGPEHNIKHPSVIFALINLFLTCSETLDKVRGTQVSLAPSFYVGIFSSRAAFSHGTAALASSCSLSGPGVARTTPAGISSSA